MRREYIIYLFLLISLQAESKEIQELTSPAREQTEIIEEAIVDVDFPELPIFENFGAAAMQLPIFQRVNFLELLVASAERLPLGTEEGATARINQAAAFFARPIIHGDRNYNPMVGRRIMRFYSPNPYSLAGIRMLFDVIRLYGPNTAIGARARIELARHLLLYNSLKDRIYHEQAIEFLENVRNAYPANTLEGAEARCEMAIYFSRKDYDIHAQLPRSFYPTTNRNRKEATIRLLREVIINEFPVSTQIRLEARTYLLKQLYEDHSGAYETKDSAEIIRLAEEIISARDARTKVGADAIKTMASVSIFPPMNTLELIDRTIFLLREAIKINPKETFKIDLARILLMTNIRANFSEVINLLKPILLTYPNPRDQIEARSFLATALILRNEGDDLVEAIDLTRKIMPAYNYDIAATTMFNNIRNVLARALLVKNTPEDLAEAMILLEETILSSQCIRDLSREEIRVLEETKNLLAIALTRRNQAGDPERALTLIEEFIAVQPRGSRISEEAMETLRHALSLTQSVHELSAQMKRLEPFVSEPPVEAAAEAPEISTESEDERTVPGSKRNTKRQGGRLLKKHKNSASETAENVATAAEEPAATQATNSKRAVMTIERAAKIVTDRIRLEYDRDGIAIPPQFTIREITSFAQRLSPSFGWSASFRDEVIAHITQPDRPAEQVTRNAGTSLAALAHTMLDIVNRFFLRRPTSQSPQ